MRKKTVLLILIPTMVLLGVLGWFLLSDARNQINTVSQNDPKVSQGDPLEQWAKEIEDPATPEQGSLNGEFPDSKKIPETEETSEPEETPEPEEVFEEYDITLMALGDNLIHMGIVYTGSMEDGTYDYTCLFEDVSDYLEAADIKMINQETIFGGNELGFSGYPYFNSPTEVGDAIAAAGFNVVLHATNHTADQGIRGLYHCADYWKQYPEVLIAGIAGEEDTLSIPLLTIDDITFAILNYTYGPNMGTLPSELRGHLSMLCDYNESTGAIDFTKLNPQVITDIQEARQVADVVVVCPHWGTEYQDKPSTYQRAFAEEMTQAGADLIIGTHPHVPQPVEWVDAENGNRSLCFFSLGNYVSTQKQALSMLEGMAWVTFHVAEDGISLSEEKTGVLPLICHYKSSPVRLEHIYPLEEYTEELAGKHGIRNYGGVDFRLSDLQTWSQKIFGDWVLTEEDIISR